MVLGDIFLIKIILNATEIQKHLFPEVKADIFLSHAHADEDKVISLAVSLENMGFKVLLILAFGIMLLIY